MKAGDDTMSCKNKDIKEVLPAYVSDELTGEDLTRVKEHLRTCADCAQEAALLRLMASEPVPDPGEAFWAEMPGRVYSAVQRDKAVRRSTGRPWHDLLRDSAFSRWAWVAAAAGIVLVISWFIVNPMLHRGAGPAGDEYAYDDTASHDPVLRHTSSAIAELTPTELDAVDSWAATELSSLAVEAGPAVESALDTDLTEELAELDAPAADRLSTMLNEMEEG